MNNMSSEEKLINSSFVSTRKQPYVLLRNMQYIVNHRGSPITSILVMDIERTFILIKYKRFLDRNPLV